MAFEVENVKASGTLLDGKRLHLNELQIDKNIENLRVSYKSKLNFV
jgi:hypothetical protein